MLVHVAIVSDQLLPTVIPCLMHRPARVVLVASRQMAPQARRLHALFREAGLAPAIRESAPDAGLASIRAYAAMLAEALSAGSSGDELVFNATGGTKLMTLGFVEVFRERADRIIYTDTARGPIEVIHDRRTAAPQPEPMRDVLDVPRYLAVQGFRYESDGSQDAALRDRLARRRPAARYLAAHAAQLDAFIGTLNRLASQALEQDALARPGGGTKTSGGTTTSSPTNSRVWARMCGGCSGRVGSSPRASPRRVGGPRPTGEILADRPAELRSLQDRLRAWKGERSG